MSCILYRDLFLIDKINILPYVLAYLIFTFYCPVTVSKNEGDWLVWLVTFTIGEVLDEFEAILTCMYMKIHITIGVYYVFTEGSCY